MAAQEAALQQPASKQSCYQAGPLTCVENIGDLEAMWQVEGLLRLQVPAMTID